MMYLIFSLLLLSALMVTAMNENRNRIPAEPCSTPIYSGRLNGLVMMSLAKKKEVGIMCDKSAVPTACWYRKLPMPLLNRGCCVMFEEYVLLGDSARLFEKPETERRLRFHLCAS